MAPIENNGAMVAYRRIIRPTFLRYHHKVDELISNAQDAGIYIDINTLLYTLFDYNIHQFLLRNFYFSSESCNKCSYDRETGLICILRRQKFCKSTLKIIAISFSHSFLIKENVFWTRFFDRNIQLCM